jgi:hypothetical protein
MVGCVQGKVEMFKLPIVLSANNLLQHSIDKTAIREKNYDGFA